MAEPYTLNWFLLHAKSAHLDAYFRIRRLLEDFAFRADDEVGELMPLIEALPESVREGCERDFRDIYRLGNRAGCDAIVAASRSKFLQKPGDQDFIRTIGPIGSYQDQAFWSFLNRPHYFEAATLLLYADAIGADAWEHHPKVPKADPRLDPDSLSALSKAIGSYFREVEGRDTRCEVRALDVGDRFYVECVFEGPYDTRPTWQKEGLRRRLERSARPLLYMYARSEGKLDVYMRGTSRAKWDAMAIFAREILQLKKLDPPPRGRASYALERFKRRGRHFTFSPDSDISSTAVSMLRLTPRLGPRRHVILHAQPLGRSEPIYDLLEKELKSLELDDFEVTQVEIKAYFARTAHQRQRTISTVLTVPNRCSIGYDEKELIVRRMLVDSGIDLRDSSDGQEVPS